MIFDIPPFKIFDVVVGESEYMGWATSDKEYNYNETDRMCTELASKYENKTFLRIKNNSYKQFIAAYNTNREVTVFKMVNGLMLWWDCQKSKDKIEQNMWTLKNRTNPFPVIRIMPRISIPLPQKVSESHFISQDKRLKTFNEDSRSSFFNRKQLSLKIKEPNQLPKIEKGVSTLSLSHPDIKITDIQKNSKQKSIGLQTELQCIKCQCRKSNKSIATQTNNRCRNKRSKKFTPPRTASIIQGIQMQSVQTMKTSDLESQETSQPSTSNSVIVKTDNETPDDQISEK